MNNSVIIIDSDSDDEGSSLKSITKKNPIPSTSTSIITSTVSKLQKTPVATTSTSLSVQIQNNNTKDKAITSNNLSSNEKKISTINENNSVVKKRKLSESTTHITSIANNSERPRKRIQPILISSEIDKESWYQIESPIIALDDIDDPTVIPEFPRSPLLQPSPSANNPKNLVFEFADDPLNVESVDEQVLSPTSSTAPVPVTTSPTDTEPSETNKSSSKEIDENSISSIPFKNLLKTCREADSSDDMNVLIKKKLLKYYFSVHPDFVVSKGFSKTCKAVTEEIKLQPDLVYLKLKTIIEELKVRRKDIGGVMSNEDVTTTGSQKKDEQVRRLNKSLHQLTKYIAALEKEECNLDEEISSYIKLEKYKKRACEIYEKICDLTGESKHAHRSVKKPIKFNGTDYQQFNRAIEKFVNKSKEFPDFFDVLQLLECCNKTYGFCLRSDDMRRIAQDAFEKIGRLLQMRRKGDLYETAVHFTGTNLDPALDDPELNAKLIENQKHHSKISQIIDKYAAQQDAKGSEEEIETEGDKKENLKTEKATSDKSSIDKENCSNKSEKSLTETTNVVLSKKQKPNGINNIVNGNEKEKEIQNKIKDGDDDTNSNHSNSSFKSNKSNNKLSSKTINGNNNNNNIVKNIINSTKILSTNSSQKTPKLITTSLSSSSPSPPPSLPSLKLVTPQKISDSGKNSNINSNSIKNGANTTIDHKIIKITTSASNTTTITTKTKNFTNKNSTKNETSKIEKNVKNNSIISPLILKSSSSFDKIEEIIISDEEDS